jgi:hypothetical protein
MYYVLINTLHLATRKCTYVNTYIKSYPQKESIEVSEWEWWSNLKEALRRKKLPFVETYVAIESGEQCRNADQYFEKHSAEISYRTRKKSYQTKVFLNCHISSAADLNKFDGR